MAMCFHVLRGRDAVDVSPVFPTVVLAAKLAARLQVAVQRTSLPRCRVMNRPARPPEVGREFRYIQVDMVKLD